MSVISIRSRRTTDLSSFERFRKSDASLLFADAANYTEFTVELTLGELFDDELSETRAIMYGIEDAGLHLRPGMSVVVEVAEQLRVPNNMFGLVMPKGYILLEQGILMASTKIEPLYAGRLRLLLHNSSRVHRVLTKGTIIASAIFFRTERTLESDTITSREAVIKKHRGLTRRLEAFIAGNLVLITLITAVIVSSVFAAIITFALTR